MEHCSINQNKCASASSIGSRLPKNQDLEKKISCRSSNAKKVVAKTPETYEECVKLRSGRGKTPDMTARNTLETFVEIFPAFCPDVYEIIEEKLHNRCDCCDRQLYAIWKDWDTAIVGVTTWFQHGVAVRECDECHP